MNKKTYLTVGIVLTLLSCRKENPTTLPENSVLISETCSNGIMDGDELGLDCGPTCNPCQFSNSSCSATNSDNQVNFNLGQDIYTNSAGVTTSVSNGLFSIRTTNSEPIIFYFTENPAYFSSFTVTNNPNPSGNQVYVVRQSWGTNYISQSGEVHLNKINDKVMVDFCDVNLVSSGGSSLYASGKLID